MNNVKVSYPYKFIKLSPLLDKWLTALACGIFYTRVAVPRRPPEGLNMVGVFWLNLLPGLLKAQPISMHKWTLITGI